MERNYSIDIAKAIAILLMILGHCPGIPYLLRNTIFSFHMPLFFIFSGYFYKERALKDTINSGLKHLVFPYLITSIFIIVLCISAQEPDLAKDKIVGSIMSNGGWPHEIIGRNLPYIGPIWFLLALFWCKIFYACLKRITNKCLLVSFLISTTSFVIGKYILNLPFGILTGFCGLIFYSMGDYWHTRLNNQPINAYLLAIGVVIWAFCIWKSHLELATFECKHYPLNMIAAFVGTYVTYLVSQKMPSFIIPTMCWIGSNTLLVLCYHSLTQYILLNVSLYVLTPMGIAISTPGRWLLNFGLGLVLPAIHVLLLSYIRSFKGTQQ